MGIWAHWPRGRCEVLSRRSQAVVTGVSAQGADLHWYEVSPCSDDATSLILVGVRMAEKALIAEIRRAAQLKRTRGVVTGIGDDCAVLRLSSGQTSDTLVTTDFSLEGVHFRRDWHTPESVGHRCLTRGLSDIAAMGGEPTAAFLSLAIPPDLPKSWIKRFTQSLISLAGTYGVTLAGGDTAESPDGILADIVVVGTAPKGTSLLRSRARAGDLIYVTGELGGAAAAVVEMQNMRRRSRWKPNPRDYPRHFFPEARLELGRILRERKLASAMIDTSDGLSTDLAHICEESGVGAKVQAELIPRASVGRPARQVNLQLALHGGEDYELLFTAPRSRRIPSQIAGIAISRIGQITRGKKMVLIDLSGARQKLRAQGWEHFRR